MIMNPDGGRTLTAPRLDNAFIHHSISVWWMHATRFCHLHFHVAYIVSL